jgi:hypothetical protein
MAFRKMEEIHAVSSLVAYVEKQFTSMVSSNRQKLRNQIIYSCTSTYLASISLLYSASRYVFVCPLCITLTGRRKLPICLQYRHPVPLYLTLRRPPPWLPWQPTHIYGLSSILRSHEITLLKTNIDDLYGVIAVARTIENSSQMQRLEMNLGSVLTVTFPHISILT